MSTDPVILNPAQSRKLRALAHAVGCLSIEELLMDVLFSQSPKSIIDELSPGGREGIFLFTDEEKRRIEEASLVAREYPNILEWDEFTKVAEKMPLFDPANYPAPIPANVTRIEPHLQLVK